MRVPHQDLAWANSIFFSFFFGVEARECDGGLESYSRGKVQFLSMIKVGLLDGVRLTVPDFAAIPGHVFGGFVLIEVFEEFLGAIG